jgi:hypothetical protein
LCLCSRGPVQELFQRKDVSVRRSRSLRGMRTDIGRLGFHSASPDETSLLCGESRPLRHGLNFAGAGYARHVQREQPDRGELVRLVATTELLLSVAERVDGEIADEAILADLYELRDRAHSALRRVNEREEAGDAR